jgi:hypothetical protein
MGRRRRRRERYINIGKRILRPVVQALKIEVSTAVMWRRVDLA